MVVEHHENSENFLIGRPRPNSAPNGPEPTGRLRRGVHMARAYGRMVPRRAGRAVGPEPAGPDRDVPEHSWNVPEGAQPNPDSSGPEPNGRAYGRMVPNRAYGSCVWSEGTDACACILWSVTLAPECILRIPEDFANSSAQAEIRPLRKS